MSTIHTDATRILADEQFRLIHLNGGLTAIQTANGHYVTAVAGGGRQDDAVHTDATRILADEQFRLIPLNGGLTAIQTANGHYVTAVGGGGREKDAIHTDATRILADEQFRLVPLNGSLTAIQTVRGNYFTAVGGGGLGRDPDAGGGGGHGHAPGPPSTTQLNRIGQAIVEALSQTITLIPIGDEGGITMDDLHFVPASNTIHFHATIHYKQSSPLPFGPALYDFTTFYQGDIDITDPVGSIQKTQYGFDLPNIPGFGPHHVALNAGQLTALGGAIAAIL
jgi:hypothetical protein